MEKYNIYAVYENAHARPLFVAVPEDGDVPADAPVGEIVTWVCTAPAPLGTIMQVLRRSYDPLSGENHARQWKIRFHMYADVEQRAVLDKYGIRYGYILNINHELDCSSSTVYTQRVGFTLEEVAQLGTDLGVPLSIDFKNGTIVVYGGEWQ